MTLEAMRFAVARMLTDPAYQRAFLADAPGNAAAHGLTADEFRALAQLDPAKLGIVSEGFAGKRFERVASLFPRTLAALDALEPGARGRYLATTAFPAGEDEERGTFLGFVRSPGPLTPDAQRLLQDLADLEAALLDAPRPSGLPSYRYRPEATRPRLTRFAMRLRVRGPLATALDAPAPPAPYPAVPAEVLVLRDGPRIVLEDLASGAGNLLAACDGTRTVAELAAALGPEAEERVQRWLKLQVVEDAAVR